MEYISSVSFSTLAISRDLEATGFTKSQAEGIAEKLIEIVDHENNDWVTKDYLKAEIGVLRAELKTEIAELRSEMKESKIDMIKWLIGLQFTSLALTFGFIYFLLKN